MTRINSAIDPKNLTDQHLVAELRELPRIFTAVNKRLEKDLSFDDIPKEFTLGTGHMTFFYDKLDFLYFRFYYLKNEYKDRYQKDWNDYIQFNIVLFLNLNLLNNHTPTEKEKQLLVERISTRIWESKQIPRYYGEKITKEQAIKILNQ
jgi:deoxyribonuclease (pyrimidine dimer)